MKTVLYFAYGSNLDEVQMKERCPGARPAGIATLPNHALTFGGFSHRWSGAVASVRRAVGAHVDGLLYRVPVAELATLDHAEGHPFSYVRTTRMVRAKAGRKRAVIYLQPEDTFEAWPPPREYLLVLAREYARRGFALEHLVAAVGGPS
jgi:gamma-glutamylcyclotransferase (GGCT)/AIG2-like uncharacterized protein YtfP